MFYLLIIQLALFTLFISYVSKLFINLLIDKK